MKLLLPNLSLPVAAATGGLIALGIIFLIYLLVEAFFLWVAGEIVVGRRVTYGEAIAIAFFGTLIVGGVLLFSGLGLISLLIAFFLFLLVVKGFFHTGWLGAIGVSIVSIIVAFVLFFVILVVLGLSLLGLAGLIVAAV